MTPAGTAMRILLLEYWPSTLHGGQPRSTLDVGRGLAERGHEISLIYVLDGDLLPEYRRFCRNVWQARAFSINARNPLSPLHIAIDLGASVGRVTALEPDLIYSHRHRDALFAGGLATLTRTPLVMHLREPAPPNAHLPLAAIARRTWELLRNKGGEPLPNSFRLQQKLGLAAASLSITPSHRMKEDWQKAGHHPPHFKVIHNGIHPEKFAPGPRSTELLERIGASPEAPIISYAGRLDREKGLETLIDAFALLRHETPDAHLVIAGRPHAAGAGYETELRERARTLSLERRVHFTGHLADTAELFRTSTMTVLPSLWDEPFGRTIIESMSCGTPAIGSRVGGIPEILTGEFSRLLVPAGDPPALADAMRWSLTTLKADPEFRHRCRRHIERHFDVRQTIRSIEQAMLDLLADRRTSSEP